MNEVNKDLPGWLPAKEAREKASRGVWAWRTWRGQVGTSLWEDADQMLLSIEDDELWMFLSPHPNDLQKVYLERAEEESQVLKVQIAELQAEIRVRRGLEEGAVSDRWSPRFSYPSGLLCAWVMDGAPAMMDARTIVDFDVPSVRELMRGAEAVYPEPPSSSTP